MTPNLAEVRAAAEIVRYWLSHPDADEPTMEEQEERGHAAQHIADYILSTIHADDHLPVTAEWLREEWGAWRHMQPASSHDLTVSTPDNALCIIYWSSCEKWSINVEGKGHWIPAITTRHQFRLLAGALGITPKKEG